MHLLTLGFLGPGHTCASPAGVFGHYMAADGTDPWVVPVSTTYSSDSLGVAQVAALVDKVSLYGGMPIYGRAVVVHHSAALSGARAGCGVIGETSSDYSAKVMLQPYPGADALPVSGVLQLSSTYGGAGVLRVRGVVGGLAPSTSGGWHVHSGASVLCLR